MYPFLLAIHNLLRWVVVVLMILTLVRAYRGWLGKRDWTSADRRSGVFLSVSLDIQLLIGLLLYVVYSPITRLFMRDVVAAMNDAAMRFFGLEHLFYMFLAVVLAHLGGIFSRRGADAPVRHRTAAIFYSLAALALILGMPWMRPLFPGL
jgi:Na+-driven multidrug efflux pump